MQLKEIRDLFVFFLKQLNKNDVNLLLNYLPIFLEDMQRDPLLLDKLPAVNILNFKGFEQPNVLAAIAAAATISSSSTTPTTTSSKASNFNSTDNTDGSDEENKNDENAQKDESASGTDNDFGSTSNYEENNQTGNNFIYESYDEDEENIDETNQTTAQYLEPSQIVRSRLPTQTIDYLTKMYNINKYPNSDEIYQISLTTNLTTKKVKTWFDSTRFKLKHSKKNNFTPKIVNFLMGKYELNDNPSRNEILDIANEIKLSETQVYHWFRYKRQAAKQ